LQSNTISIEMTVFCSLVQTKSIRKLVAIICQAE
jgi:hypothetical protein